MNPTPQASFWRPSNALILFWILLLGGTVAADFFNPHPPKLEVFMGRGSRNLWNGKVTQRLDDYFPKRSLVFTATRPMLASSIYRLTGEIQSSVGLGYDGWLFHQWELEDHGREEEQSLAEEIQTLASLRDLLASRHMELLVVVVPSKVRIYPEFMYPGGRLPAYIGPKYHQFQQRLVAAGIPSLDLEGAFLASRNSPVNERLYHSGDHHWTDLGCLQASTLIATLIRQQHPAWCNQKPGLARLLPPKRAGGASCLYDMLGFGENELKDEFVHDCMRHEVSCLKQVGDPERLSSPIILTGDSFAATGKQMALCLEFALQSTVRDESVMGGETHVGLERVLKAGVLNSNEPRLVICVFWEATTIGHNLRELRDVIRPYQKVSGK